MFDTSRLRAFSGLLFLKALQKKHITVPAYTKADGTYVPAHQKLVNYNPDHHAVLSGKSSHSHKEALKQAHKLVPDLKGMPAEHQSHIIQSHAQDIQTAASKGAQVSVFKKDLLAGNKPKDANIAAFKELLASDPQKAVGIRDSIIAAIGMDKFIDLVGLPPESTGTPVVGVAAMKAAAKKMDLLPFLDKYVAEHSPAHINLGLSPQKINHELMPLGKLDPSEWDDWNDADSPTKVADYAEKIKGGAQFPAPLVSGDENGANVTDGHHRVAAAIAAGKTHVPVIFETRNLIMLWGEEHGQKTTAEWVKSKEQEFENSLASKPGAKPVGPTKEELAIAHEKLMEIASGAPGKKVGQQAYKLLEKDPAWVKKNAVDRLTEVVAKWKELQAAATHGAKISTFTSKLAAGKVPSPSEMEAYTSLDGPAQTKAIQSAIKKSGHKLSVDQLNDLLDQAAAKAGIEQVVVPASPAAKPPHFGQQHEGMTIGSKNSGSVFKFEGGKWFYNSVVGSGLWSKITNHHWEQKLDEGLHPTTDQPLKVLDEVQPNAPQPDTGQWNFDPSDMGFGGSPAYTMSSPSGGMYYVAYSEIDGTWQVGEVALEEESEEEFKDYNTPERVISYLQAKGIHPPELQSLLDMGSPPEDDGPQEGDTKQGVGGVLTLKDGHWVLNNGAMISFFSKHKITPGTPFANAVVAAVQSAANQEPWSNTMDALKTVKSVGLFNGWTITEVNNVISAINGETAKMAAVASGAEKPSGVAEADAAGFEPDVNTPAPPSGSSYEHLLHNTTEGHNKFWKVVVDPVAKTATTTWGKIGAKKPGTKVWQHVSGEAALKAAKDAAKAKKGKGYVTVSENEGAPIPPPPKKSFGKQNEGKVFSAPMSTGTEGFYKYQGGSWHFSFDPANDGWDAVDQQSLLHDKLETGFNASGKPLGEFADANKPKWSFEPGQVFEAGYSASSSGKMTFKYAGDGQWESPHGDGWTPVTVSAWKEMLNSGYGLDGKPITEIESPDGSDEAGDFGSANEGKIFTSTSTPGLVLFKHEDGGWEYSTNQGEHWVPIAHESPLGIALDAGQDAAGDALIPHVDDGPKEGDVKPGKDGWLILKDGHWVKASLEEAMVKLCPVPDDITSTYLKQALGWVASMANAAQPLSKLWKKVKTTKFGMPNVTLTLSGSKFVGRADLVDGKWQAVGGSIAGANIAKALNWLEHAGKAHKAILAGKMPPPSPFPATAAVGAPTAAPAAPSAPPSFNAVPSIDSWEKVGEQGGYNEGGTYADPDGVQWYCKFPAGGAKVARNELLANKLYEAAGLKVPEVKLVSQGGKVGLASKIVVGASKNKSLLQSGQGEGLLSGFVADAWLANWDVVGNNPAAGKGWDNIMFKDGLAYRIDPGGALLYGGAGGKKAAFGDQVIELDTMRDPKINARTAKVFAGISQADLKASAEKVLSISDEKIDQLVQSFGPGDASEKAALAKTLKARKVHIAAKFPSVAAKVAKAAPSGPKKVTLPSAKSLAPNDTSWVKLKQGEEIVEVGDKFGVHYAKIKVPPSGFSVAGIPKPPEYTYSTSPHVNAANTADLKRIYDLALSGATPDEIKNMTFEEISKATGEKTGKLLTIEQHPSTKYLLEYHSQVMAEVKAQLEPTFRTEQHGSFTENYSAVAKAIAEQVKTIAHSQFKAWADKAADYLVLDRSIGESIPVPDKGHFKDVETLSSPLVKDWVEQSKSAFAKLSASEQKAVRDYTGNSVYHQWNTAMRLGETESPAWQSSKPMRDAFDRGATELPAGIIIHRGINVGNQTYKSVVGAVIQDGSFQSTSYGTKAAFSSSTSQLRLHITSGVKGMLVSHASKSGAGEREIVLDRNCRYLVMGVEGKHIDVLVLPHEE